MSINRFDYPVLHHYNSLLPSQQRQATPDSVESFELCNDYSVYYSPSQPKEYLNYSTNQNHHYQQQQQQYHHNHHHHHHLPSLNIDHARYESGGDPCFTNVLNSIKVNKWIQNSENSLIHNYQNQHHYSISPTPSDSSSYSLSPPTMLNEFEFYSNNSNQQNIDFDYYHSNTNEFDIYQNTPPTHSFDFCQNNQFELSPDYSTVVSSSSEPYIEKKDNQTSSIRRSGKVIKKSILKSESKNRKQSIQKKIKRSEEDQEDTKRFYCEPCGKLFKRSEHLKRHIKSIHEKIKDFCCNFPDCNKSFSRSDNLNQHLRIHRSVDPTDKKRK